MIVASQEGADMGDRRKGFTIGVGLVVVAALVVWLAIAEEDGDSGVKLVEAAPRAAEQPAGFESAGQPEPASLPLADVAMTEVVPAADAAAGLSAPGTGRLMLRVTWASDGQPAAQVGVSIVEFSAFGSARVEHRGVTDVTGTTARDGLRPGKVGVYLDRANGVIADVRASETTELAVAIPAATLVRGVVVDADGRSVAGADIRLGMGNLEEGHLVARADADGRFTLRDVREHAMVGAQAEGHVPSALAVVRGAPEQVMDVTLVLGRAGAVLAGRVLDARGEPVPGAEILVGPPHGWPLPGAGSQVFEQGPPPRRVFADEQGAFAVRDLPPGHWPLAARHAGCSPWLGQCELRAGATLDQDIALPDAAVLSGVVRDGAGQPVPDASVTCGDYAAMDRLETRSAANGHYELSGLPLFGISVRASAEGAGKDERELAAQAGERLEWDPVLTLGLSIVGRVEDEGGAPVAGHHVDAANYAPGRTTSSQALTDEQGRFTLVNCADGEHELRVFTPDWKTNVAVVRGVRPGPDQVVVTVVPVEEPSAFLVGRLLDTAGQVPAQATVGAADVRTGRGELVALDAAGAFRCGPLRPGAWDLRASVKGHPQHRLGRFDLAAGETRDLGTLLLPRPGRLVVHASLPPGADPGQCFCSARSSEGHLAHSFTLEDGVTPTWTSEALLPGDYEVTLTSGSGGADSVFFVPARASARVEEGRDTPVDLVALRGVAQSVRLHSLRLPAPATRVEVTDGAGSLVLAKEVHWYSYEESGPDDDGYISFVALPGAYTLRVTCDGTTVVERSLELPPGVNIAEQAVVDLP
jgi:protocatechuate 3,4-dioxygenase beta subunit